MDSPEFSPMHHISKVCPWIESTSELVCPGLQDPVSLPEGRRRKRPWPGWDGSDRAKDLLGPV